MTPLIPSYARVSVVGGDVNFESAHCVLEQTRLVHLVDAELLHPVGLGDKTMKARWDACTVNLRYAAAQESILTVARYIKQPPI
jgi:hypothetical protein